MVAYVHVRQRLTVEGETQMGRGAFLASVAALLIAMAVLGFGIAVSSGFQTEGCRFAAEPGLRWSAAMEWAMVASIGGAGFAGLLAALGAVIKRRFELGSMPLDVLWPGAALIMGFGLATTYQAATCDLGATWTKVLVPLLLVVFITAVMRRLFMSLDIR